MLAFPGDLETPTGGYVYDSRVIEASGGALAPLPLPTGFPNPTGAELAEAARALAGADGPALIDGLAYGAMPEALIRALPRPPVALCHHPLAHETGLDPATAARLRASERAALGLAAHVVATSETTKRALVAEFGLAPERVTVAVPGLDRAAPATPGPGAPMILSVGSLTPRKDHATLLAALGRLDPALAWRCVIAGATQFAPETAASVRAAAQPFGPRVTVRGALPRAELEALYGEASVFALASRYEGYGMVFAEAMMRGLPVVACRAGAAPEVVPPEAGALTPPGDADAFAAALDTLLRDPARRAAMGTAARARALTIPDWGATWALVRGALERAA